MHLKCILLTESLNGIPFIYHSVKEKNTESLKIMNKQIAAPSRLMRSESYVVKHWALFRYIGSFPVKLH